MSSRDAKTLIPECVYVFVFVDL